MTDLSALPYGYVAIVNRSDSHSLDSTTAKGGKRMGAAVMMKRIAEASPRFMARIAGVLSLLSLLAAVFGEFIVRRFEIAGDLIAVSGNIVVTLLLYGIFKPVNVQTKL